MIHLATQIGDLGMAAQVMWAWLASEFEPAATTLVTSIWQGAVIVCGLQIAMRLMPRISAAYRFAVWAAGFGIALGLPWLPLLHFGCERSGIWWRGSGEERFGAATATGCAMDFGDCGAVGRGVGRARGAFGGALGSATAVVEGRAAG